MNNHNLIQPPQSEIPKKSEIICPVEAFVAAADFLVKNSDRPDDVEYNEISAYARNIRRIVVFVLNANKKLNFDLHSKDIISEILWKLKGSDDIKYYGIAKKVEEVLEIEGQWDLDKRTVMQRIEELNTLLSFDPATSLPNRTKCVRDISTMEECGVVILSVRNFSDINNAYGRETGDWILVRVANALLGMENALGLKLYKYSGTEYALVATKEQVANKICYNCTKKWAKRPCGAEMPEHIQSCAMEQLADRIAQFLRIIEVPVNGYSIHINFAVGGSYWHTTDILHQAQIASEESVTRSGKPVIYTEELGKKVVDKHNHNFEWIDRLRLGIQDGNVVPFFQGIYDNRTGTIMKYEALARFKDWDSIVSPHVFLWPARTGMLLGELTKQIFDRTIEHMMVNPGDFSINVTDIDLLDPKFVEYVGHILKEKEIATGRLTFEILESVSSSDGKEMVTAIERVKSLGVKIAIDDFGTWYSNFERLLTIQPHYIKIDGSLVRECVNDLRKKRIVASIVTLAHSIGAEVIAEFVDSQEVANMLISLGVEYSQGFLYSKPSPTTYTQ